MGSQDLSFTEMEDRAFNALFDAITRVLGTDEYRLVDPIAKIGSLFDCAEEAAGFIQKLVSMNLISLVFIRPGDPDGDARPTYRAAYDQWPDAASSARRVPEPPFKEEERQVRTAIARKRERRQSLADRREKLAAELQELDASLAALDGDIKAAEATAKEFGDWRRRLAAITSEA